MAQHFSHELHLRSRIDEKVLVAEPFLIPGALRIATPEAQRPKQK
jgi:hypothetical protein